MTQTQNSNATSMLDFLKADDDEEEVGTLTEIKGRSCVGDIGENIVNVTFSVSKNDVLKTKKSSASGKTRVIKHVAIRIPLAHVIDAETRKMLKKHRPDDFTPENWARFIDGTAVVKFSGYMTLASGLAEKDQESEEA